MKPTVKDILARREQLRAILGGGRVGSIEDGLDFAAAWAWQQRRDGRREAFEEAAKIADAEQAAYDPTLFQPRDIAAAIRARMEEK